MLRFIAGSLAKKYISLDNHPCITRPTIIDSITYTLCYYLFMASLRICDGICKFTHDPSGGIWIPNKTEDVNLEVFNIKTEIKE